MTRRRGPFSSCSSKSQRVSGSTGGCRKSGGPWRAWSATRDGVPYLRPEVQLLYKGGSSARRAKDLEDLRRMLPAVGDRDRLAAPLAGRQFPGGHEWLAELALKGGQPGVAPGRRASTTASISSSERMTASGRTEATSSRSGPAGPPGPVRARAWSAAAAAAPGRARAPRGRACPDPRAAPTRSRSRRCRRPGRRPRRGSACPRRGSAERTAPPGRRGRPARRPAASA